MFCIAQNFSAKVLNIWKFQKDRNKMSEFSNKGNTRCPSGTQEARMSNTSPLTILTVTATLTVAAGCTSVLSQNNRAIREQR